MGRCNKNYFEIVGNIVIGHTNKGEAFLFDKEDLGKITPNAWTLNAQEKRYLVAKINGKIIRMHRHILGITNPKIIVDHINGNTKDNRKENLRIATAKQNSRNCVLGKNNTTGYPGIRELTLANGEKKYAVRIMVNRKEIYLGRFDSKEKAIERRKCAEKEYFGKFSPHLGALKA